AGFSGGDSGGNGGAVSLLGKRGRIAKLGRGGTELGDRGGRFSGFGRTARRDSGIWVGRGRTVDGDRVAGGEIGRLDGRGAGLLGSVVRRIAGDLGGGTRIAFFAGGIGGFLCAGAPEESPGGARSVCDRGESV